MLHATHTIRRTATALALAATIVAVVAPAALAGGNSQFGPPDGWYPYAVSITKQQQSQVTDGRSPDTRDAAAAAQAASSRFGAPDGWYPYAVSITSRQHPALLDGRCPDTQDAAQAAQVNLVTPGDGRAPDTIDAATQAHIPVVTVIQTPGFQWGDFGIGVAAAFGLICLVAVSTRLLTAHKNRKQPGSVATA